MRTPTERILRPWLTHKMVEALRLWAELIDVARVPWPDKATASATAREQHVRRAATGYRRYDRGRDFALGAFTRAVDATPLIVDRCSLVAVAVERFRRDRGTAPAVLSEIVPQYLAALPIDPFTGKPLLFHSSGGGYTVYSVGPDGKDDGGDLTSKLGASPFVRWSRLGNGADVGVRVLTQGGASAPSR